MDRINHKGMIYNIISTIVFSGTVHLIIQHQDSVEYINKEGNKFLIPPKDITLDENKSLPYVRKQLILKFLIDYIRNNGLYSQDKLKRVIYAFKEFIMSSLVETFLYWPYIEETEFNNSLKSILSELEMKLQSSLIPLTILDEKK